MANPTSNFGWQMPTNTDLVKDLPADFEVFGQAVDTSLMDLKGGTTGQVLSKASNTDMDFTWVTQDDANAIQNSIVDAKGDLITATADDTPARLAVGANHAFLKSLSSASTGLEWTSDWTTYTSVWASDGGTNPTLGNSVITAKYMRIGKLCAFSVDFNRGSTATNGTGSYKFSLPFSYAQPAPMAVGTFYAEDAGVAGYVGVLTLVGGDSVLARVSPNSPIQATSPFTWGTNDFIRLSGVYEVA